MIVTRNVDSEMIVTRNVDSDDMDIGIRLVK